MDPIAPPSDSLRALLSGKRKAKRHLIEMPVTLGCVGTEFDAVTVDVSEGGALIAVAESDLEAAGEPRHPGDYLGIIENNFREPFDVRFSSCKVVVEAELVRLSVPHGEQGQILLGCRFTHDLGRGQCVSLGIAPGNVAADEGGDAPWREAVTPDQLDLVPDPHEPLCMLLYDAAETISGPRYVAVVTSRGGNMLGARMEGVELKDVTETLGTEGFLVRLMRRGSAIWESRATLTGAQFLDAMGGGVELCVLPERTPPRRVRRLFRRRR